MGKYSQPRSAGDPQENQASTEELLSELMEDMNIEPLPDSPGADMNDARYVPEEKPKSRSQLAGNDYFFGEEGPSEK
jgi:hypothetical protein